VVNEIYFLFQNYIIYMDSYDIKMSCDPKYNLRFYAMLCFGTQFKRRVK